MLSNKNYLTDEWSSIINFFQSFPHPIYLISHNGIKSVFPLLKLEIDRLALDPLPKDIYFVDSLEALREIEARYIENIAKNIQGLEKMNVIRNTTFFIYILFHS